MLFTADGMPLLADLGVARLAGPSLAAVDGTAEYVDPAVAAGATPAPASDVWALAAVCHHLLAGTPPHDGVTAARGAGGRGRGGAGPARAARADRPAAARRSPSSAGLARRSRRPPRRRGLRRAPCAGRTRRPRCGCRRPASSVAGQAGRETHRVREARCPAAAPVPAPPAAALAGAGCSPRSSCSPPRRGWAGGSGQGGDGPAAAADPAALGRDARGRPAVADGTGEPDRARRPGPGVARPRLRPRRRPRRRARGRPTGPPCSTGSTPPGPRPSRAGDPAALAATYAPGSPALVAGQGGAPRRSPPRAARRGACATPCESVAQVAFDGTTARLRLRDVLAPYEVLAADGAVLARRPARGEAAYDVVVVRTAAGFRLAEVQGRVTWCVSRHRAQPVLEPAGGEGEAAALERGRGEPLPGEHALLRERRRAPP